MNKPTKLNQCLECKHGAFNKTEFYKARLTGCKFIFDCQHPQVFTDRHITTNQISKWHNHCKYYEQNR